LNPVTTMNLVSPARVALSVGVQSNHPLCAQVCSTSISSWIVGRRVYSALTRQRCGPLFR